MAQARLVCGGACCHQHRASFQGIQRNAVRIIAILINCRVGAEEVRVRELSASELLRRILELIRNPGGRREFYNKLPRTTLGTGLARTGTNTGTPEENLSVLLVSREEVGVGEVTSRFVKQTLAFCECHNGAVGSWDQSSRSWRRIARGYPPAFCLQSWSDLLLSTSFASIFAVCLSMPPPSSRAGRRCERPLFGGRLTSPFFTRNFVKFAPTIRRRGANFTIVRFLSYVDLVAQC